MQPAGFKKLIYDHYKKQGRNLPWRIPSLKLRKDKSLDPYKILVSEIMLQQTQVDRVIQKYQEFIKKFPTLYSLAEAKRIDVLHAWQGLGYNRRALYLKKIAEEITNHNPSFLKRGIKPEELERLKGIGKNTAASICAFAFNMPVVFIETNIRTVFLKHFFPYGENVHDAEILKLVEKTLDTKDPRQWYWALMDYGSYLKHTQGNLNRLQSAQYAKQSKFKGSRRELRGRIIKTLLQHGGNMRIKKLEVEMENNEIFYDVLERMEDERLLRISEGKVCI